MFQHSALQCIESVALQRSNVEEHKSGSSGSISSAFLNCAFLTEWIEAADLKLVAGLSSIRVAFLHCGVSSIRAAAGAALGLINPTRAPQSRSSSSEIN